MIGTRQFKIMKQANERIKESILSNDHKEPMSGFPSPMTIYGNQAVGQMMQAKGISDSTLNRRPLEISMPIPEPIIDEMEQCFNADFSGIRLYPASKRAVELGALSFAQGPDIHFAPGRYQPHTASGRQLLGHELTHVMQQAQGRVRPNQNIDGTPLNADPGLEAEADRTAGRLFRFNNPADMAAHSPAAGGAKGARGSGNSFSSPGPVVQRKVGFEFEMGDIRTRHWSFWSQNWYAHPKGSVIAKKNGYKITTDEGGPNTSQVEMIIDEIDETNVGERNNLIANTVPAVEQMIDDIATDSYHPNNIIPAQSVWTGADQINNLNGSSRDQLCSISNGAAGIMGQLQLTAGLSMNKLSDFVSGQQGDNFIGPVNAGNVRFDAVMADYKVATSPIWNTADHEVANTAALNGLPNADLNQLSAVITLLATIPIEAGRANNIPYPKALAGKFLARTDFSKIMLLLPNTIKAVLTAPMMTNLVVNTINGILNPNPLITANDQVFPAVTNFVPGVPLMTGLTIGNWITRIVPTPGRWWGYWQGQDLLTKKSFPGTANQRSWIESMGAFKNKTDPGSKPIFEFRTLTGVFVQELNNIIAQIIGYLILP